MSVEQVTRRTLAILAPPPDLTVSEWADEERRLSPESSASPGRFRTDVIEHMREPMDMVGKPGVRRITLMTSAQVAKTTVVENVIGYFIDYDPCPILVVNPTIKMAEVFSKQRLAPMVRDTPALRGKIADAKSRDSGNTIDTKQFPGGVLSLVGANAPSGLASRPIRVVLFDEVDRFEESAGTEGDPVNLAIKRTTTYWNRVIISVSTPGDATTSRINKEYEDGDMRLRWCPCHACGAYQTLKWSQVKWDDRDPNTARYECEHCNETWDDAQRIEASRKGHWKAQREFNGNVSYHLSQLYSPFAPLSDGVRDFLAARGNPMLMKTWVNTFLGEVWREEGQRLEWSDLMEQREQYVTDVPEEVTVLTVGADTQDDRFEIETVGWGDDDQSWSIAYHVIYGDLSTPEPWNELRRYLKMPREHPLFGDMMPRMSFIDSGGHYTQAVYKFCKTMARVAPIKGIDGAKPMVGKPSKNNLGGTQVFPLGVDTIKEVVVARYKAGFDEPGYCRFPHTYDAKYFQGATAEELRTRFIKGFPKQEWHKIRPRNEPFDCRVYATGALELLGLDLNAHRRSLLREVKKKTTPEMPKPKRKQRGGDSTWVDGWKNG